jgi:hypothetical protein
MDEMLHFRDDDGIIMVHIFAIYVGFMRLKIYSRRILTINDEERILSSVSTS